MIFVQRMDTTFNQDGSVKSKGTGAITGKWPIKQFEGQEYLQNDHPDLLIPLPDNRTYRQKRAEAYIQQSSPEGQFATTVGDWIDAIADFIETSSVNPKLQNLLDIRANVKQQFPQ